MKLDRALKYQKKRPNFLKGTMREVVETVDNTKLLMVYLSGEDQISKEFEQGILTQKDIIEFLDENYYLLGLNESSNEGRAVGNWMQGQDFIIPLVLIIIINK
mmetsp:Transcript_18691/g.17805  ORF Transcript_18691/g.17805 Transcript_18691/m.17805 type:complete len:103 (-) Transcript_18691:831-1139(-)|eukprot:CAMPEP_0170548568 /NCGR_PEP_ID=MMETSP0211-20121228/6858_1 /TAXON_ID=311385 /ORGANISM="Pseudokeronopsis sp., Strain OXSARD2" /LENGTH=102 /DNA_ID=CAMNT_0010854177 /DNA_START=448 /DNA_END=756 /DNA_ORIENTATION=+